MRPSKRSSLLTRHVDVGCPTFRRHRGRAIRFDIRLDVVDVGRHWNRTQSTKHPPMHPSPSIPMWSVRRSQQECIDRCNSLLFGVYSAISSRPLTSRVRSGHLRNIMRFWPNTGSHIVCYTSLSVRGRCHVTYGLPVCG